MIAREPAVFLAANMEANCSLVVSLLPNRACDIFQWDDTSAAPVISCNKEQSTFQCHKRVNQRWWHLLQLCRIWALGKHVPVSQHVKHSSVYIKFNCVYMRTSLVSLHLPLRIYSDPVLWSSWRKSSAIKVWTSLYLLDQRYVFVLGYAWLPWGA